MSMFIKVCDVTHTNPPSKQMHLLNVYVGNEGETVLSDRLRQRSGGLEHGECSLLQYRRALKR